LVCYQSINQSISQSFYFRNKPISEIDRKTGETEETTKTLLILLKLIKSIVHTISIEAEYHTQTQI